MAEVESFEEFKHVEADVEVGEFRVKGFEVGVLLCVSAGPNADMSRPLGTHVDVFGDDGGCFGLQRHQHA